MVFYGFRMGFLWFLWFFNGLISNKIGQQPRLFVGPGGAPKPRREHGSQRVKPIRATKT